MSDGAMSDCELSNPLILDRIFSQLSPADLKTVAQVSRYVLTVETRADIICLQ